MGRSMVVAPARKVIANLLPESRLMSSQTAWPAGDTVEDSGVLTV
jgi:hypothetical protein